MRSFLSLLSSLGRRKKEKEVPPPRKVILSSWYNYFKMSWSAHWAPLSPLYVGVADKTTPDQPASFKMTKTGSTASRCSQLQALSLKAAFRSRIHKHPKTGEVQNDRSLPHGWWTLSLSQSSGRQKSALRTRTSVLFTDFLLTAANAKCLRVWCPF